jgi:hypothetical protein
LIRLGTSLRPYRDTMVGALEGTPTTVD